MTVGELLAGITSAELTEWMAFAELEPFGEERDDLRAAIVASTVAEVNRNPKKRKQPFTPQDFLPKFSREVPEMDEEGEEEEEEKRRAERLAAKWAAVVAAFGKK